MATPGARRRELGGSLLSRHLGDAEVDEEGDKEDILEGEVRDEEKKEESNKGCASILYILYSNFMFNSGPAWRP